MKKTLEKGLSLAHHIEKKGFPTVLVGGAVRDLWLGLPIRDIDLSTAASPETLSVLFPSGHPLGQPPLSAFLVPWQGESFELVSWTGAGLNEDLARRDLTVNAMALTTGGDTLDPCGGMEDLLAGRLRFNGAAGKRLAEDPVRAVRLARFAATLPGFTVPAEEIEAVRAVASELLLKVAAERIGAEFLKSLCGDLPLFLHLLERMELFSQVLPEATASDGVSGDRAFHPKGDAFGHNLLTVREACRLSRDPAIRTAALFHDVRKAFCATEDGSFREPDVTGAKMAQRRMTSWALPSKLTETVTTLMLRRMTPLLSGTPHAMILLARRHGPDLANQLFTLALAGLRASDEGSSIWRANRSAFLKGARRLERFPLPMDGRQIMELLGIPPGPEVGRALADLEEAVAEGKVSDREEARVFLLERADTGFAKRLNKN